MATGGIDSVVKTIEGLKIDDSLAECFEQLAIDGEYVQLVNNMTLEDKSEVFEWIFNTPLEPDNVKTTYLVCKLNNGNALKIKNIPKIKGGIHAEIQLRNHLQKIKATEATVFINNSPCDVCSLELLKFLQETKNWKIDMFVADLYYFPSVQQELFQLVNTQEKATVNNLKTLKNHPNCTIDGFDQYRWRELWNIMGLGQDQFDKYATKREVDFTERQSRDTRIGERLINLKEI